MATDRVLDKIRRELIDPGRDTRYKLGAYNFVLKGLEFYLMKIGVKRHVSGQELCRGLAEFAARQFGPLALELLKNWGISRTDDFGCIVYNMIELGIMSRLPHDSLEDFHSVFDLKKYFGRLDYYTVDSGHIRAVKGA
jgi:uncharacterized repeat protein (TIGR04138 family)